MKIVFIAPRFHTNQYEIVKVLQANGHDVEFHVNYIRPTEEHSILTPKVYPACGASKWLEATFGSGGGDKPRLFPNPITYFRELIHIQPDILIIRNPNRYFSILAALYARFLGIKTIFYTQTEINKHHSLAKRIKAYLLLSIFNAAWYSPLLGADETNSQSLKCIHYVPFAVPQGKITHVAEENGRIIHLLMIGKYGATRKNHLLFIEALAQLKDQYKFHATIVGEFVHQYQIERFNFIQQKVYELGMQEIISLEKNIPFLEMQQLYNYFDIFVLPSRDEPAAISILEAMANGVPAVCSDTCGTKCYIKSGKNGYVFKSDDLLDLVDKIQQLLEKPQQLLTMKKYCLSTYAEEISGQAYYQNLNRLLQDKWNFSLDK